MTVPSLDAFGIFNAAEEWSERVKRVKSKSTEGGFKKGKLVCRTEAEDEVLVGGGGVQARKKHVEKKRRPMVAGTAATAAVLLKKST